MTTLYLIAHKVRGELAFDVAQQLHVDGYSEPWWIIPTSGHRAYPFWSSSLDAVIKYEFNFSMPSNLRDHYTAAERPKAGHAQPRTQPTQLKTLDDLLGQL